MFCLLLIAPEDATDDFDIFIMNGIPDVFVPVTVYLEIRCCVLIFRMQLLYPGKFSSIAWN